MATTPVERPRGPVKTPRRMHEQDMGGEDGPPPAHTVAAPHGQGQSRGKGPPTRVLSKLPQHVQDKFAGRRS